MSRDWVIASLCHAPGLVTVAEVLRDRQGVVKRPFNVKCCCLLPQLRA